jgi:hypothetical protein
MTGLKTSTRTSLRQGWREHLRDTSGETRQHDVWLPTDARDAAPIQARSHNTSVKTGDERCRACRDTMLGDAGRIASLNQGICQFPHDSAAGRRRRFVREVGDIRSS